MMLSIQNPHAAAGELTLRGRGLPLATLRVYDRDKIQTEEVLIHNS